MLIQFTINGIIIGLVNSLTALGFGLIYNATRVFHILYGALYTFSIYVLLLFFNILKIKFPFLDFTLLIIISTIISILLTSIFSILIEILINKQLYNKKSSFLVNFIASLGVYIITINSIVLFFGNDTKVLYFSIEQASEFLGVLITKTQVIQILSSLILIIVSIFIIRRTTLGIYIRALSDNPNLLLNYGKDINLLRIIIFIFSSILVSTASLLRAIDSGIDPNMGLPVFLYSSIAVILSGSKSFTGIIFSAIIIGIIQNLVLMFTSSQWQDFFTFLIVILILFFRNKGLVEIKLRIEET